MSVLIIIMLTMILLGCNGIRLDDNSTTARIWAHLKSKGGSLLLERPGEGTDEPVTVTISLYIQHIRALEETKSEIVYDMYARYSWMDTRMAYGDGPNRITLPMSVAKNEIWMPDLFFANAHDASLQSSVDIHSGVFITKEGQAKVSARITVTAHCNMDLKKFPHDRQVCGLAIESYMFGTESLKMVWGNVQIDPHNAPSSFISQYKNKTIKTEVLATGEFERADVTIDLVRINRHYIVLLYVPCFVLLLLSMLLFWLPLAALLERTLFGAILLFCMTVIMVSSQYASPQVGYLKAVDIWVVSCFVFLAVAILEILILHLMFGRSLLANRGNQFELIQENDATHSPTGVKIGPWLITLDVAHKIDISLRVIYPASFVLFNAIYWGVCTV